jgi:DNA-binding response OmpR family regulator
MSIFGQFWSRLGKTEKAPANTDAEVLPDTPAEPTERRTRPRVDARTGTRALIIDDSQTMVAAIRKMLRSAGYETTEALDAETGVELARQQKPELIFLDIVLPGMNGFAALRLMRKDPLTRHIPIIMISGNEQATEQFYAKRIGADDFMKKPFSRNELFARIEILLDADGVPHRKDTASPQAPATTTPTTAQAPQAASVAPMQPQPPSQESPAPAVATASPGVPLTMTALEARKELAAMGLLYYDQEQFVAAIRRGDMLALELFVIGGGVNFHGGENGKSVLEQAQGANRAEIVALLKKHSARLAAARNPSGNVAA